jgi:hypothetical protein
MYNYFHTVIELGAQSSPVMHLVIIQHASYSCWNWDHVLEVQG